VVPTEGPPADPDREQLEQRLRPGRWSRLGLLGAAESLDVVLARDAETMACLDASYDELADRLGQVQTAALEMYRRRPETPEEIARALARQTNFPVLGRPETIPRFDLHHLPDIELGFLVGHLQVFIVTYKSWENCPWGCDATTSSDFMIVNRRTGDTVTAPELMPHLIRTHHFFGGPASPYRADPERLARVLEMSP
jgi:hypothetical protein